MNLEAKITVKHDGEKIRKLFAAEKEFENNRAGYSVAKKGKGAVFTIKANDSVALRAMLNSITKMLTVFEKAINLGNEQ
ncbi:MAG: KEOPS complex subunit Pcc1 [Candidatus Woesearchaeota archaeon]